MSAQSKNSILWLLTGVMVLIFAAACGSVLSGAATAVSAMAGLREESIAVIAMATLLFGFALALVVALRDLVGLARRNEPSLPWRWVAGSVGAMFVAGPFWSLCVVHYQESISDSDLVRILFDYVHYGLVLSSTFPLALGVPLLLKRVRRQACADPALAQK